MGRIAAINANEDSLPCRTMILSLAIGATTRSTIGKCLAEATEDDATGSYNPCIRK